MDDAGDEQLRAPAQTVELKSGETVSADFSLAKEKRLSGVVLDMDTGAPIGNCTVTCTGPDRPKLDPLRIQSDDNGEFEFFVSSGKNFLDSTEGRRFGSDSTREVDVPSEGEPAKIVLKVGEEHESVPRSFKIFMGKPLDRLVSAEFDNEAFQNVLKDLCNSAGVKAKVDEAGMKTIGLLQNMKVSINVKKVTLREALTKVLKPFDKLAFSAENGEILIGPKK